MINKELLNNIFNHLAKNKITFSTVESVTGGYFANLFTSISGASKFFDSGIISYSNNSKMRLLAIDEQKLIKFGAVSKEIAEAMVIGAKKLLDSELIISFTGNAGPQTIEAKAIGLIYLAIYYQGKIEHLSFCAKSQERQKIIVEVCNFALAKLAILLKI